MSETWDEVELEEAVQIEEELKDLRFFAQLLIV